MIRKILALAVAAVGMTAIAEPALAQNEQFVPALVYRTGPYAPNGVPFANGVADYWTLSTSATAASTASRSSSRNARPATPPTRAWNAMSA